MAKLLTVNGRLYELESPGHLCLGFCLFDVSYPGFDEPPQRLAIPYSEIRARSSRPKEQLQRDLDSMEEHVGEVRHQISHGQDLDKMEDGQWRDCRDKLVELVDQVAQIRGISTSVATKILHRHFPHVLPILDELCVRDKHGYNGKVADIMDSIRRDMILSESAIDEAISCLSERLEGPHLTRLRVFDVLLWSVMNADRKQIRILQQ